MYELSIPSVSKAELDGMSVVDPFVCVKITRKHRDRFFDNSSTPELRIPIRGFRQCERSYETRQPYSHAIVYCIPDEHVIIKPLTLHEPRVFIPCTGAH